MSRRGPIPEVYDDPSVVDKKVKLLVKLLLESNKTIVYTGAGISTAASIPDYRGPEGVWTLASQGKSVTRVVDMKKSNPTLTHMCLREMYERGLVSHILSQNCDGLHLRSGLPHSALSEIHGNMFIEVCDACDPCAMYTRPFDCTDNSGYQKHTTPRNCSICGSSLRDTIVHFGEVGKLDWPLNWNGTYNVLEEADLILCLGSSLDVLKSYTPLWPSYFTQTKVVIINLQHTAKDGIATVKINCQTDIVMKKLADALCLTLGAYCRRCDPVLNLTGNEGPSPLMNNITKCTCGDPLTSILPHEEEKKANPGWWSAEIARIGPAAMCSFLPSPTESRRASPRTSTRKAAKKSATRTKKEGESRFEKDIRETVLNLLYATDDDSNDGSKKRGRRKLLSVEKPGAFKLGKYNKKSPPPTAKATVADHEWESEAHESSSDGEADPSFEIPEKMMENTFWRGPPLARKSKKTGDDDGPPAKKEMSQVTISVDESSYSSGSASSTASISPMAPSPTETENTEVQAADETGDSPGFANLIVTEDGTEDSPANEVALEDGQLSKEVTPGPTNGQKNNTEVDVVNEKTEANHFQKVLGDQDIHKDDVQEEDTTNCDEIVNNGNANMQGEIEENIRKISNGEHNSNENDIIPPGVDNKMTSFNGDL